MLKDVLRGCSKNSPQNNVTQAYNTDTHTHFFLVILPRGEASTLISALVTVPSASSNKNSTAPDSFHFICWFCTTQFEEQKDSGPRQPFFARFASFYSTAFHFCWISICQGMSLCNSKPKTSIHTWTLLYSWKDVCDSLYSWCQYLIFWCWYSAVHISILVWYQFHHLFCGSTQWYEEMNGPLWNKLIVVVLCK